MAPDMTDSLAPVIDLPKMREAAGRACSLMRALSNPDRLMLLCQLAQGERRVGELEELLDIQQPTLSQQLAVLRDEQRLSGPKFGCGHSVIVNLFPLHHRTNPDTEHVRQCHRQ